MDIRNDAAANAISYAFNKVYLERFYVTNGKIVRCDRNYGIPGTDVRLIKFSLNTQYRFLYEKNAKVSDLVRKHNADYGFNAAFFNLGTGQLSGDAKDRDTIVSTGYGV